MYIHLFDRVEFWHCLEPPRRTGLAVFPHPAHRLLSWHSIMAFSQKCRCFGVHDGKVVFRNVPVFPFTWYVVLVAVHIHQSALCVSPYACERFGCEAVGKVVSPSPQYGNEEFLCLFRCCQRSCTVSRQAEYSLPELQFGFGRWEPSGYPLPFP